MKTILLAAALLGTLTGSARTQRPAAMPSTTISAAATATTASPADQALFTKLVGEVAAAIAKHDMEALGKLMTPDYTHFDPNNTTSRKADELAFISTWPPTTSSVAGPVLVNRSGNMAVTVARVVYEFNDGKTPLHKRTIEHMIAWTLNGGNWQMAVVQSKETPG